MYSLSIDQGHGFKEVQLPSGWHEVSFQYYKDKIEPYYGEELSVNPVTAINLFCSMLDIDKENTSIWDYGHLISKLVTWMSEIPETYEFELKGKKYKIPALGKQSKDSHTRPYLTVADWETVNDAIEFLNQHDILDSEKTSDMGLIVLCALARGDEPLNDEVFAQRLEDFKECSMDVILNSCFFLLRSMSLSEIISQLSFKNQTALKRVNLKNFTLDGLSIFYRSQPLEFSKKMAQAGLQWRTPWRPVS